ncbi:hypothetical protein Tco_1319960 [Tanacetum coccineum]
MVLMAVFYADAIDQKHKTTKCRLKSFVNTPLEQLDKDSDEEEVIAAGDDMDGDPQDDKEVRTPSPKQDQPEPSHVQESAFDSSSPPQKVWKSVRYGVSKELDMTYLSFLE